MGSGQTKLSRKRLSQAAQLDVPARAQFLGQGPATRNLLRIWEREMHSDWKSSL